MFIFNIIYKSTLCIVSFYTFIKNTYYRFYYNNKDVTFVKTKSIDNIIFYEHLIKFKNKYVKLYLPNKNQYDIKLLEKSLTQNIIHACICSLDENNEILEYIMDVTDYLKYFRHYLINNTLQYNTLLQFISMETNILIKNEYFLYININDREIQLKINNILNKFIIIID